MADACSKTVRSVTQFLFLENTDYPETFYCLDERIQYYSSVVS